MEARGIRSQIVLATKYTSDYHRGKGGQHSTFVGNNAKSMHNSLHDSLRKLRTDYVDIFYVHWVSISPSMISYTPLTVLVIQWDWTASVPEVMNGLHNLVVSGKVLYLVRSTLYPLWLRD